MNVGRVFGRQSHSFVEFIGEIMGRSFFVSRAIVAVAVVAALGGCAASPAATSPATASPAATETAVAAVATSPVATNAFSYACKLGGDCGAFMTLTNEGSDANKLVSATTTVTDRAELHTVEKNAAGEMKMSPVIDIAVPAGGSVELKPGSFHVMMFGLSQELKVGDTFPVTLKFEQGADTTVQVLVQEKN
jgi:periplasmic copper chaperone A